MNFLKRLFNNIEEKSIQGKVVSNGPQDRNRILLDCMKALEFGAVEIRQAMMTLNKVKVKELAKIDGVSAVNIYNTVNGRRTSRKAMDLIAHALDLSVDDLFPQTREPQARTPEALNRQL